VAAPTQRGCVPSRSGQGKDSHSDSSQLEGLLARVLAGFSIAVIISSTSGPTIVPPWMQALARNSALFLDLYDDAVCTTSPGERTHRINDNVVIVGAASGADPTYVRRLCTIAPE